jgi:predicted dehydrogenase
VFVTEAARWDAIAGTPDLLDDLATHQLDLLRFLLSEEIESVSASRTATGEIRLEVRLTNGSAAICRVAHHGPSQDSVRVAAGSQRAWIHAKSDRMAPADGTLRVALDFGGRAWRRLTGRPSSLLRSFEHELRGFVAMVQKGTEPNPGTGDAVSAARAVAAARNSLARGNLPVTP